MQKFWALLSVALVCFSSPAQSAYLYKYIGTSFQFFERQNAPSPRHTRSNRVTVELTLPENLGPNVFDNVAGMPYLISDGLVSYTNLNSEILYDEFFLVTDRLGNIVDWRFTVLQGDYIDAQGSRSQIISSGKVDVLSGVGGADIAEIYRCRVLACPNPTYTSAYTYNQGVWSITNLAASAVPEPETWLQIVLGFAVLGYSQRRSFNRSKCFKPI
jgi:hypothetical protein